MLRYLALAALLGCGSARPAVAPGGDVSPQIAERELSRSIDDFVAAGRTPAAYQTLSDAARATVERDPRVAPLVERRLVTLALFPAKGAPAADLALTVWPTLLAPAFDAPGAARLPLVNESAAAYVDRLCTTDASLACATVDPAQRETAVAARVAERAAARTKHALAACDDCRADDGWNDIRRGWNDLERTTATALAELPVGAGSVAIR